jgi:hypothetical protein
MAESRQAWDQVGKEFADLGRRVRQRYEQQPGHERPAPAERRKVEDALRQLADSLDQAFSAVGDALRDPEFGQQTRKAATSLSDALSSTFAEVSERFRTRSDKGGPPPVGG